MKITACPHCGSKKIFQGTMGDGVLTGYITRDVCRNCGYQGNPILFDSEDEYQKFLEELKTEEPAIEKEEGKEQSGSNVEDESVGLSEKDKEVIGFINEIANELPELDKNSSGCIESAPQEKEKERHPLVTLGLIVIVVGILITAATYGSWITFTGALLFVGLILVILGYVIPKEKIFIKSTSAKPTIAGILLMLAGVLGLLLWTTILLVGISSVFQNPSLNIIFNYFYVDDQQGITLVILGILGVGLSFFSLVGGIYAIIKKHWCFVIFSGIAGLFTILGTIFSLIGLVVIAFSRKEFR